MNAKKKTFKENYTPVTLADLESCIVYESLAADESAEIPTPCRIHIHSKRFRSIDADGASAKAAIDGAVHAGILPDDSAKEVKEVSYSQEKSKEEITILEFWSI